MIGRQTLRLLHVLAPQPAGGLERAVELLAGGLAERGHRVAAVVLLDRAGDVPPVVQALESSGVEVTPVRAPARFYWREARAVAEALRATGAQVVHAHGYRADVLSYRPGRRARTTLVSTAHGFTGNGLKNHLYEWLDRRILRRYDAVIAVSDGVRHRLIQSGVDPARVRVVVNGVGRPRFLPRAEAREALGLAPEGACVGWVGRMTPEKGADLLVEALRPVAGVRAEVVLVGDGRERAAVEHGGGPGFRFLGQVPGAGRLLPAFDVLALSSRTEGTPMVVLEAMQAGVPVAAFAVGGVPPMLEDGAGRLAPPGDTAALRNAVLALLDDQGLARRCSEAARARVESSFGLETWLDRVEGVYREAGRA